MKSSKYSSSRSLIVGLTVAGLVVAAVGLASSSAVADAAGATKEKVNIRENSYYYSAFNKRDPFRSLIVGDFVSEKKMSPVDMARVELVGIVKGELDRFALLEDEKGFSYIVRIGDHVKNGSVLSIGDEYMVASVTNFGQTRKLTLRLDKGAKGDKR
jgi:hypothetical protein